MHRLTAHEIDREIEDLATDRESLPEEYRYSARVEVNGDHFSEVEIEK